MFVRVVPVLLAGLGLVAIGASGGQQGKTDQDLFQGTWVLASAEVGGKKLSADELKQDVVELTFVGNKVKVINQRADKVEEGTFQLDSSKSPKEIDFTPGDSNDTHQGIYEIKGNTLKVCMGHPPQMRPTEYASKEGEAWPKVFIMERKKRHNVDKNGASDKGADKKSDEERILGEWEVLEATKQGSKAPDDAVKNFRISFDKAGNLVFADGDRKMELKYKLDATKDPKEIDVTEDEKGLHKGIYVFEGENLKMCTAHPPLDRPTEFASPEGVNMALVVLKRAHEVNALSWDGLPSPSWTAWEGRPT